MSAKKRQSRFKQNVDVYANWSVLTEELEQLPKPTLRRDAEGEVDQTGWIFRGHKSHLFRLQPSIEREYPYFNWPEVEHKILREFQSKAPMHMNPTQLPRTHEEKLSWLAIMQHYGAPTRLLDFTYSPYVALYFALRNRRKNEASHAELWGIDGVALQRQAAKTSRAADTKIRVEQGTPAKGRRVSFRPQDLESPLQATQKDDAFSNRLVSDALNPCGVRRTHFNQYGLVALALPPVQSPRLSCQQGVFLFNLTEPRHGILKPPLSS
jgi:hypothetical protein